MNQGFLDLVEKKEEFFLALDIGTEAVKALIFFLEPDSRKIVISGASLHYFETSGVYDGKDLEREIIKRAVSKAIKEAVPKELKEKKRWPVFLGLPANLLKERISFQSFQRKNPKEKISKREEESIYQDVFRKAKEEISQRFSKESGILGGEIQWFSLKVLEGKIDGYSVPNLSGYQGRDLELRILVSFLPRYYFDDIKGITKDLDLEILELGGTAENLAFSFEEKKDGLFLDIGGEISQIIFLKDGNLEKIGDFAGGGREFSRVLSRALGIEERAARLMKEKYSRKILSREVAERIKETLASQKMIWYENFQKKIKEMDLGESFPWKVFLFGGGGLLPEIQDGLEEPEIIYPKDLPNIEEADKVLKTPQMVPPFLTLYYAQEIF